MGKSASYYIWRSELERMKAQRLSNKDMNVTVCPDCQYPHSGVFCNNPGCYANPSILESIKVQWRDADDKRAAEQAKYAKIRRLSQRELKR